MKKALLLFSIMGYQTLLFASESFEEALNQGKFSANLRAFYFDRSFDKEQTGKENATALTAGGIVKYESAKYNGLSFGFAHYSSTRLGNIFSRTQGAKTSILGREGEDLAFLGEAYLSYSLGKTLLKAGRQQLSTPLMQNHDLRILPSVYEAIVLKNRDIPNSIIEVGFVDRYTGFTSKENAFLDTKTGKDGLLYLSFSNKSINNLSIRGEVIDVLTKSLERKNYTYLDANYKLPIGNKSYIKGQLGTNGYRTQNDSTLFGLKSGTTIGKFNLALLYDKISNNQFQAFEAGPLYSDWQQGYGLYEASSAVGGQILYKPYSELTLKVGFVDVQSETELLIDDFTELNLDIKYTINSWSKIRLRYSRKDQSEASEALMFDSIDNNGGREDRDDFRVIYYMNF
jgi:hypothetical protein